VAQLHPLSSSSEEASPDVVIQDVEEGAKGSKKRHEQRHQETAPAAGDDGNNNKQVASSNVVRTAATTGSGKRQAQPLTYYFEKLLVVKHKLKDCGIMKNFIASGSLTRGMEIDEGDAMPFLREDRVKTIYDGHPSLGMHRMSNPSLGNIDMYITYMPKAKTGSR
jgi:hypothetical protein